PGPDDEGATPTLPLNGTVAVDGLEGGSRTIFVDNLDRTCRVPDEVLADAQGRGSVLGFAQLIMT
ncbi:MAG: hypothetical protein ACRDZQ_04490, partial [Acidimicrobiales bacterium]